MKKEKIILIDGNVFAIINEDGNINFNIPVLELYNIKSENIEITNTVSYP